VGIYKNELKLLKTRKSQSEGVAERI